MNNGTNDDFTHRIEEVARAFILVDNSGKELLKLDEETPMEPKQGWLLLRAYIPQRTRLPIVQESRKSPFGGRSSIGALVVLSE